MHHPTKFHVIPSSSLGGVCRHTNRQTNKQTHFEKYVLDDLFHSHSFFFLSPSLICRSSSPTFSFSISPFCFFPTNFILYHSPHLFVNNQFRAISGKIYCIGGERVFLSAAKLSKGEMSVDRPLPNQIGINKINEKLQFDLL